MKEVEMASPAAWRVWLAKHHASSSGVWLVFRKTHTGMPTLSYGAALDEALCYGWIDSLIRRLDADRYARKFTPRKPGSRWSSINRKRYAALKAAGRLAAPGRALRPTDKSGDAPPAAAFRVLPRYIAKALRADAKAWRAFDGLAPSYRRQYVAWIDSAKREATKAKRLREAIVLLAAGKKLGLK
jgi:uncharacterized protein YdeI (YjbR/CyaY-like superfamily)